ncbi:MAG: PilZ domain-containing protein [Chloroflexota bacterium]
MAGLALLLANWKVLGYRLRWALAFAGLALQLRYLAWRGLDTLVFSSPSVFISLALFAAEIYSFLQLILFYFQVARPTSPRADLEGLPCLPEVDVFIPTYDEPLEVIERTAVCCLGMDYPGKTVYILDDGRRPQVEQLASRLGCRYLTRPNNRHAKAGNINEALARTSGELVLIFDADHAPVQSFLRETVGFFSDPRVAFVQTEQHFYNPDPFQHNLLLQRVFTNEQDLFFKGIMPGRDRYNAAFWTGSGAVFRRRALQEVGGVRPETLTEDFHTSLELHSRGWRSVHLNRVLSAGLSPESYSGYILQRVRWAHGAFQTWWRANPLFRKGLSLGQRLCYYSSIHYFMFGWARMVFLLAPLAFLLFGLMPLRATPLELAIYYLPQMAVIQAVFPLLSGRRRLMPASDLYETALCFFQAPAAVKALLFPRSGVFKVTPKGERRQRGQFDLVMALPHLGLALLIGLGLGLGLWRLQHGLADRNATIINGVWAMYNLFLALGVLLVARELPQRRRAHRLSVGLPCEVEALGATLSARTVDFSEAGASIRLGAGSLPPVVRVSIFPPGRDSVRVAASVTHSEREGDGQKVGLRFLPATASEKEALIRLAFGLGLAWQAERTPRVGFWRSLGYLAMLPLEAVPSWRAQRRRFPRFSLNLRAGLEGKGGVLRSYTMDCSLEGKGGVLRCYTMDCSLEGLGLVVRGQEAPGRGQPVSLSLGESGNAFSFAGEVAWAAVSGPWVRLGIRLKLREEQRPLWARRLARL